MLVTQAARGGQISGRSDLDPRLSLNDLNQKGGKETGTRLHRRLQRCDVAERHNAESWYRSAETTLEELRVGRRHAREREAVEGVASRQDAGAAGAAAGQLDCGFDRFRAAVREDDVSEPGRRHREQSLRQLALRRGRSM